MHDGSPARPAPVGVRVRHAEAGHAHQEAQARTRQLRWWGVSAVCFGLSTFVVMFTTLNPRLPFGVVAAVVLSITMASLISAAGGARANRARVKAREARAAEEFARANAAAALRILSAPAATEGQCPVCGLADLERLAADDEFLGLAGPQARVVDYGDRRAHQECRELVPAPPTKKELDEQRRLDLVVKYHAARENDHRIGLHSFAAVYDCQRCTNSSPGAQMLYANGCLNVAAARAAALESCGFTTWSAPAGGPALSGCLGMTVAQFDERICVAFGVPLTQFGVTRTGGRGTLPCEGQELMRRLTYQPLNIAGGDSW